MAILQGKIEDLEKRIEAAMNPVGIGSLVAAKNSSALDFRKQLDFIDAALMEVPKRHYDPTLDIVELFYRQRFEFLAAIAEELGV